MTLDFNTISAINLPEGLVTKIIANGVLLWQQQSEPEPIVDPTNGTMSFGNNTTMDASSGTVEFQTTPTVDEDGVVDFGALII